VDVRQVCTNESFINSSHRTEVRRSLDQHSSLDIGVDSRCPPLMVWLRPRYVIPELTSTIHSQVHHFEGFGCHELIQIMTNINSKNLIELCKSIVSEIIQPFVFGRDLWMKRWITPAAQASELSWLHRTRPATHRNAVN
jgi:hypothetical protein